ncbi:hypothetical protein ACFWBI_33420 [Streptomyces sp. NPDC059982]|uniref:hypothetical protein n=1 Tax=unclassified Streptomyces TaxID=2593676 RepID=UPI0034219D00
MPQSAAARRLERLRGVEWDMRWDLAFARVGSRRVLMWEYLRRAAVWASACGAEEAWPFYDVTAYLAPEFGLGREQEERLAGLLRAVPGEELRRTCAGAVRLAELGERAPAVVAGLPDPYEPLVLFYERGGSFTRDCSGSFLDLVGALYKPGPLRGFLGARPVGPLGAAVLDALDADGRVTYYMSEDGQGPLLRRRVLRDEHTDELFGRHLRWEPTDLVPGSEQEAKAAGLAELDELKAANLIGTIVAAAPGSGR